MIRYKLLIVFLFSFLLSCPSVSAKKETPTGMKLAGNLLAYPYDGSENYSLTPAPEGYVPFHFEHYGRHGSRWLLGPDDYLVPVRNLEKAEKAGKLTELGKKTLKTLREIQKASLGREGDLSDKGAFQHQQIGKRMALNFPEIFNKQAEIDAKSTIVTRCIISMANALNGMQEVVSEINPSIDASNADMWFMNFDDKEGWAVKDSLGAPLLEAYKMANMPDDSFLDRLVTDPVFARDSVGPGLLPRLYWVLGNTQSHSDQPSDLFEEVFSEGELTALWKAGNAGWFIHGGHTPMTDGRMPMVQRNLLRHIIEETDSAIVSERPSARLRFGHDGILISLVTLMEVGGYGDRIDNFEQLEESDWKDYDIIPMGGNLQLIFYRRPGNLDEKDVLVKALLNEKEVSLPGKPVFGPYYRWDDLKKHYIERIERYFSH